MLATAPTPLVEEYKSTEEEWEIYACDNYMCEAYKTHWPIHKIKETIKELAICPTCNFIGHRLSKLERDDLWKKK